LLRVYVIRPTITHTHSNNNTKNYLFQNQRSHTILEISFLKFKRNQKSTHTSYNG